MSAEGPAELLPARDAAARDDAAVVRAVRAYCEAARARLRARHEAAAERRQMSPTGTDGGTPAGGHGGTRAAGRAVIADNTAWTDALVTRLAELAAARHGAGEDDLTVAAVGGYARRELCIHSDLDLLLLHAGALDPGARGVAEDVQRWLWDAGLVVGCATRSVEETLALAAQDETVRNAVLDVRALAGDPAPVERLTRGLEEALAGRRAELVAAQQAAVAERHVKYGESLYLLQPNVKEGAGGLRDYHAAWWAARTAHPEVRTFAQLASGYLLTPAELQELDAALDFLWWVRNELHFTTGRGTDQMSFELQERMAVRLGYGDGGPELPVERFMADYYRHARVVENLSALVLELCERHTRPPAGQRVVQAVEEGFRITGGQLEVPDGAHLRERPVRLLEAFAVAQAHEVPLSRTARRLVREQLGLVDEAFRRDPEAAACFERILASDTRVTRTLMAMNEVRLLGAYLPEWDHIVCRWQHVLFHTYTVDVHSIFLVEALRRLWRGKYEDALPEMTELMRKVEDRPVLFLGCLLHDVGKGHGGDHSAIGTRLARTCVERLGLDPVRAGRVVFLVEHHLLMSKLAQRRDLSDPRLIVDFARTCGDRENLRNLYLLTFADIRASSQDAWNDWKGQLLRELFERTADFLEAGGDDPRVAWEQVEARVDGRQQVARRELRNLGVEEARIDQYFAELPRRYFVAHPGPQIARHAMAVLAFDPAQVVATQVRSMRGNFSELIVVTRDVHGLYSKVAGVLTAKWINILGSYVYTTRSGLALEIYRLTTPPGGPPELRETWQGLQKTLHQVLTEQVRVEDLMARRGRPVRAAETPRPGPVEVAITNDESEFYTIADVTANDRLGLLYDLTRAIAELGLEIYVSKAATILDQVADTFYLKDEEGRKIQDPGRLEALRAALLAAARDPDGG